MLFVALVFIASVIHGQHHGHHTHSCIHTNLQQLKADQVVSNVINDMETDGDGYVQPSELTKEFVTFYDHDGSGLITETEFVRQWHKTYHDANDFASYLFHHLDQNNDSYITAADTDMLATTLDRDGDNQTTVAEFKMYMLELYKTCTSA